MMLPQMTKGGTLTCRPGLSFETIPLNTGIDRLRQA